jgi:hypothetical protein
MPAAVLMVAGYVVDLFGGAIAPLPMALAALVAFAGALLTMRGRSEAAPDGEGLAAVLTSAVVIASFLYFLWLASPSLLPVTNGPDVVHHLVLIHLIQRTHHLVHGSALNGYLFEMAGYTPGSHIVAALVASWSRTDAVRVVHPIAAAFTALTFGTVYALAYRCSEGDRLDAWQACAAPVLALVPATYTLGGFMHFFFFAQVAAGTFALAMLLSFTAWARLGTVPALVWCSFCAAGIVLAWPVWIVPPVLAVVAIAIFRGGPRGGISSIVIALAPAAVLLLVHALRHRGAGAIVTVSGAIVSPSLTVFGVGFSVCASVGAVLAIVTGRGRTVLVFAAAVLLEATALAALSRAAGSGSLYLPFKMMFLLVPPGAVLASSALARVADTALARLPRAGWTVAAVPVVIGAILVWGRVPSRRQHGYVTESALAAGEWARDRLPSACVDYFAGYWLTGYWLHLDVLGNPRESARMREEPFEFRDTVGKWIEGRGLPYAFVEDFDLVPRDARQNMTVLQRFGRAAIVRNLRPAPCLDTSPSLWTLIRSHER